ncbi:MAG: PfkB family carbohydrate kinase [Maribacter stanieri]
MINVIGGTYREIDYDDISLELFGSGFRCSKFLLENECNVQFFTSGNSETLTFLKENQKVYKKLKINCNEYNELITFKYSFALDQPDIYPNPLRITKTNDINVKDKNVIAYGMLETDFNIIAEKVVYDPQTSLKPIQYSDFGKAKELVYIINLNEAYSLASSKNITDIKTYFFESEGAKAFIIKNGPFGATLYYGKNEYNIPAYITENVSKIGSGDIFTSSFGYYWMEKKLSLEESAINASKSTSFYCDKKAYIDCSKPTQFEYKEFQYIDLSKKQIYLASPFFSLAELILIDKIRSVFLAFGIKVFSPFHDIGLGDDISIAKKDILGIEDSDIIFCVFDNLDPGTLVESGYSLSKEKKIIGYHRTCDEANLLMLKPGDFKCYKNLTTAIYKTIWSM